LTPNGVSSYLKSLTCGNGKAKFYQALRTLLRWLYHNGYTQEKVIDRVPMPKVQKRLLPAISREQLHTLQTHCHCERDNALISFLWHRGVRLSAEDFNWDDGTVTILGKGNRYRRALAGNGIVREWVCSHDSFEISPRGTQTMLKRLSREAGIKCNPHAFRRGFAVHQVKSGLSTRVVQALGGWETITMVERYSKSLTFDDALQLYKQVNGHEA